MTSGSDSLLDQALSCLRRREHSRFELRRKLAAVAESPEQLDAVLDRLESRGFLSDQRYAESVARVRGPRFGPSRIRHELQQKGVPQEVMLGVLAALHTSEDAHLRSVWERKFGQLPQTASDMARQQRFLMQRGFSPEAIRRLFKVLSSR